MADLLLRDEKPNGRSTAVRGPAHADGRLLLARPLGRTTWLARLDGTPVTARLLTSASDGPALGPLASGPNAAANLTPFLGTYALDGATWAVSEFVPGTSLDRLLGAAILTPAQAMYIAAAIFAGLADLHAAGGVHGDLTSRHVVIGTDGRPRLTGWAVMAPGRYVNIDAARVTELDAARAMVFELARNADRPVGRHSPGGSRLLVELERLGTGSVLADADATARHLADRLDAAEGIQTGDSLMRAELAALARASARDPRIAEPQPQPQPQPHALPHAQPHAQPAPARATPARPDPAAAAPPRSGAPLSGANWGRPHRRRKIWAAVAVLVVALAAAGYLARTPIAHLADRVLHRHAAVGTTPPPASAGKKKATTHVAARPHAHTLPVLAPAAAGLVRNVSVQPTARCRLGRGCPVQVTVTVRPTNSAQQIAWRVVTVDRCTGDRAVRARGVMVVSAGYASAWDNPRLALPARHPVAAIAVTATPARAASRPLLVPAHRVSC